MDEFQPLLDAVAAARKPVFFTGDWNAMPDSAPLKGMRGFMSMLSGTERGTFNAFKPVRRGRRHCIDYITVDSASAARVKTVRSWVVQDAVTSDHFPVVATLSVAVAHE